jgi:Uma2 family endonuclease
MSPELTVAEMTTEELLALPESEDVDRELIRGQLVEEPMSRRTPKHSKIMVNLSRLIHSWREKQSGPKGGVFAGDCTFRVRRRPDTTVGIDVAYVSPELAAQTPEDATFIDGVPVLAIEILSPSDTYSRMAKKVREYLANGVGLVWVVDPYMNVVYVHRPQRKPELLTLDDELSAEPLMSEFRIPVAVVFEP